MFREIFEVTARQEFFFDKESTDGVDRLIDYMDAKFKKSQYEFFIGRGDDFPHGIEVDIGLLKDKKMKKLIKDVECQEENPEDCY